MGLGTYCSYLNTLTGSSSLSSTRADHRSPDFYRPRTDATDLEVTTSYRRLSLAHHPDRNYGDASATERFQRISAAHQAITSHRQDQKAGTINGSQGRSGATSRGSWYHSGRPSQGHHDGSDDSENEDDNDIDSFFDDEDLYFSPDFGNLSVFEYFMFM